MRFFSYLQIIPQLFHSGIYFIRKHTLCVSETDFGNIAEMLAAKTQPTGITAGGLKAV